MVEHDNDHNGTLIVATQYTKQRETINTHTEVEEGSELSEDGVRSDGGRAGESLQNSFHCLDLSS